MKIWFKTQNNTLIDLNKCHAFYYTSTRGWYVYANFHGKNDVKIGEFEYQNQAQGYLDLIYSKLEKINEGK
jgi:hypothetical protein